MNTKKENEQQKNKSICSLKCVFNVINNISVICSFVGISLFGGIFFGLADILDYESICLMNECAHYLVIAAIIFLFISLILSKFTKEDSEQSDSDSNQTYVKETRLVESPHTPNISSENLKQMTKNLNSAKCDKKTKQDTATARTKPSKISPKNQQLPGISKRDKVSAKKSKDLTLSGSPKRNCVDPKSLPISSKNLTFSGTSKQDDIYPKASPLPTSSKSIQNTVTSYSRQCHILLKAKISSKTSSKNLKSGATSQKVEISARTLSKIISSTIKQRSVTHKQKETAPKTCSPKTSQLSKEKSPSADKQLVPYKAQTKHTLPEKKKIVIQKVLYCHNSTSNQSEIGSRDSTSSISSNALKLDASCQQAEFSARTLSRNSPTIPQPIGPPKSRKVSPGIFNPEASQSSSGNVSYVDTNFAPHDSWNYNPTSESNMPIRPYVPFYQDFMSTYASECIPVTENHSHNNSQLFPYNPQLFGSSASEQNMPGGATNPFHQSFMPPYASRYNSTTEILSRRQVTTLFEGGITQTHEQYQMQRTMFFPFLGSGIWSPNFDNPRDQTAPQMFANQDQNNVSDVQTKFESMNMH